MRTVLATSIKSPQSFHFVVLIVAVGIPQPIEPGPLIGIAIDDRVKTVERTQQTLAHAHIDIQQLHFQLT